MSCVNNRYTPDELESIFVWDAICEAMPLTREERAAIRERDGKKETKNPARKVQSEEQRQRQIEYCRRWRENHKEHIREYRDAHREEINERQREYDRAMKCSRRI